MLPTVHERHPHLRDKHAKADGFFFSPFPLFFGSWKKKMVQDGRKEGLMGIGFCFSPGITSSVLKLIFQ